MAYARILAAAATVAVVAGCGTVQPTETIGPNDPAALAAIRAAYVKAGEQKSFRSRMTSVGSDGKVQEATMAFAAPASYHMVMKTQNVEHLAIGGAHYMKADGKWTRLPIATASMFEQFRKDPQALAAFERTVSGAQVVGPDTVGSQRATAYRYYQASRMAGGLASSAGWVKVWVGGNGLPLKVESDASGRVLGMSSQSKTTIFYEDYGAAIRITAPL